MASRVSRSSFFESSMPRGKCARSRITAAATTGPASGAQPASSTPATGSGWTFSSLKQGRAIEAQPIQGLGWAPVRISCNFHIVVDEALNRHCEERSDEAIHAARPLTGLLRSARNDEGGSVLDLMDEVPGDGAEGVADRAVAVAEAGGGADRQLDVKAGAVDRGGDIAALAEAAGDG